MKNGITGSKFGDWLFVFIVIGFVLSLFVGIVTAYVLGPEVAISQYLWTLADPTWMPPGQQSIPLLGSHHFGDWQIFIGWAKSENPYLLTPLSFNGLPVLYWLLVPLSGLNLGLTFVIMWGLTLAVFSICFYFGLRYLPIQNRLVISFLLLFLSTGMIWSFTRGSMQALAIGMTAISIYLYSKNKNLYSGILFAVACSIKPYLLLFLLWPILEKKYKQIGIFAICFGVVSLLGFYLMNGGFYDTFFGWLTGNSHYASEDGAYLMTKGVGLFSLLLYLIGIYNGAAGVSSFIGEAPNWVFVLPGAIWILGILFLYLRGKTPKWIILIFLLAASQLVMPASQIYTMAFAAFAVLIFFQNVRKLKEPTSNRTSIGIWFVLFALLSSIVPMQISPTINSFEIWNFGAFISPIFWTISMIYFVLISTFPLKSAGRIIYSDMNTFSGNTNLKN